MKINNSIKEPAISQYDVYNGGSLKPINTENLLNNPIAIDQLLNDHNAKIKEIENLRDDNQQLISELEYQKTSPFFAIFSTIVNLGGTVVVGYGVNLLASENKTEGSYVLIFIGALLDFVGSLESVLFRWARSWFNKPKK